MTPTITDFEQIRQKVDGVPHMDAHHGRIIYDHVRETKPQLILELGTANGVSAAYMAAALRANGSGRIVTVDIDRMNYDPGPRKVFEGLGFDDIVEFVRVPDSSYDWMLRQQVADRSDDAGNCTPLYDFIFIDGAHDFTIDGLAAVLATKLLKPEGWILFDDLDWTYAEAGNDGPLPLSESERTTPNVREVFDVIIKQDPQYVDFRVQDDHWGWARKGSGPRRLEISVSERPLAMLKRLGKRISSR